MLRKEVPNAKRRVGVPLCPKSLEQYRFGMFMASRSARAVSCVLVLLLMSTSPFITSVSAHDSVVLSASAQHIVLEPGQSTNLTLTVMNNGSSITSYNISVDDSSLSSAWEVLNVDTSVNGVFPTWSKNTTVVVRLKDSATVADSGSFTLSASDINTGATTSLTVSATVAPYYHPNLVQQGAPLVSMKSGSTVNLTFSATNLGTVTDTLLLDVEVEPDLASWWANYSNGSSGGSGNNSTSQSIQIMMYGNSYTSTNNLASLSESILDAEGYNSTVTALTSGGMRLPQHWQNVATSGHQWNTTLQNTNWDFVLLQDQSQVPSFPTSDTMWQESKNASVNLSRAIEDAGSEAFLFMTWGYRAGDSLNSFNNNFSSMQERLQEGYLRYAENISSAGHAVWIAPVGLAFKAIHDEVVMQGDDPTISGNLFFDLYSSDGSHPSLAGSYLAACVIQASMTGENCVGSSDTVNLNSSTKLRLQQAADDTVFNQTAGMSYYPWENAGVTGFGLGSSIPSGWLVQWNSTELTQVAAGESHDVTLTVTIPSNALPDFYGYRLTIASTGGNITSSTILVVEVEAEPALSIAFLEQSLDFLPKGSTTTSVQVTNTGNAALDIAWEIAVATATVCTASMVDAMTTNLIPTGVVDVEVLIVIDASADSSDTCELTLTANIDEGEASVILEEFDFSVTIDELVDFSLSGPAAEQELLPLEGSTYELRIYNNGSDAAMFYLDVAASEVLQTQLLSASGVLVAPSEVGIWSVHTVSDPDFAGAISQEFSASYGGQTSTLSVDILVLEVDDFRIDPPVDDRVLIEPGTNALFAIEVENTGTSELQLTPRISGLPVGINAQFSNSTIILSPSQTKSLEMNFSATSSAPPSSTTVTLYLEHVGGSHSVEFDIIIIEKTEILVHAVQSRLIANPNDMTSMSIEVTNIGTKADVFVIDWSTTSAGSWFEFTISPTTFQLNSGQTQTVLIGVQERQQGAPSEGITYTFAALSTSDDSIVDTKNILVLPVLADADVVIYTDVDSAKPGEQVFGSVIITNTGTAEDTFTITTVGTDCGLDASVTLQAGLSSNSLGWSCILANDAAAGQHAIMFRVVSAIRSNVAIEQAMIYTVEADWPGEHLVELTFESTQISLGFDSSTSVVLSLQNLANTEVTGSLQVLGEDTGLLVLTWLRLSDSVATNQYTLSPGSSVEFKLTLTSNSAHAASAEVVVRATSSGGGVVTADQSAPLDVTIQGPALPPNGLALPFGMALSPTTSFALIGLGWLIAILAVQRLRSRVPVSAEKSEEETVAEEDEQEEEPAQLGYNECRLDGEHKVICPTCTSRLGVPRGSEPPFRFTCPKCGNKIRVVN